MKKRFCLSVRLVTVLLFVTGFAYSTHANLTLHYAFESDFTDSTPSNNIGTPNGGAVITNSADLVIFGEGSLAMDGADTTSVSLSNTVSFSTGIPWSIAFWAKRGETDCI